MPALTVYAEGASGNVAPIATIQGRATKLGSPFGVAFDANGNIYAIENKSILEFPPTANGNQKPIREIAGRETLIYHGVGIAVDAKGQIYASSFTRNARVTVYASGANGNAPPKADINGSETGLAPRGGKVALSP